MSENEKAFAVPPGYELWEMRGGFGKWFGPVYMDRQNSRMAFRVDHQHTNPVDGLHGGALATFVDAHIAICYFNDTMHCPTINLNIDYMRAARRGDWLEADIMLMRVTKNLIFTKSVVRVGDVNIAGASGVYRNDGVPPR